MNKKIPHKIGLTIALLVSVWPAITYAYNNMNRSQAAVMPPPGPYRSVMNNMPKPKIPERLMQQQKNMMLHQQGNTAMHNPTGEMPEWMQKQQQQHNQKMRAMFEQRKAEFEKRMVQHKEQMRAEKQLASSQEPDWAKERREAQQKHVKEMQLKHQQTMPQNYAEWEKNRQAEIKRRTDEFKKRQADAQKRAEEFSKQFSNNKFKTRPAQQQPPEWFVKQQQQAQQQMEFYRAQQQRWMAQQAQQNQAMRTAQRQTRPYPAARRFNRPPPQFRTAPPRYQQMNSNIPPWVNPQYQPAQWR